MFASWAGQTTDVKMDVHRIITLGCDKPPNQYFFVFYSALVSGAGNFLAVMVSYSPLND